MVLEAISTFGYMALRRQSHSRTLKRAFSDKKRKKNSKYVPCIPLRNSFLLNTDISPTLKIGFFVKPVIAFWIVAFGQKTVSSICIQIRRITWIVVAVEDAYCRQIEVLSHRNTTTISM